MEKAGEEQQACMMDRQNHGAIWTSSEFLHSSVDVSYSFLCNSLINVDVMFSLYALMLSISSLVCAPDLMISLSPCPSSHSSLLVSLQGKVLLSVWLLHAPLMCVSVCVVDN